MTVGSSTLVVRPGDIAAALTMQTDGAGTITPRFDAALLTTALGDRVAAVEQAPVDATIRLQGGAPRVVPARTGLTLDPAALRRVLLPVLPQTAPRRATLALDAHGAGAHHRGGAGASAFRRSSAPSPRASRAAPRA